MESKTKTRTHTSITVLALVLTDAVSTINATSFPSQIKLTMHGENCARNLHSVTIVVPCMLPAKAGVAGYFPVYRYRLGREGIEYADAVETSGRKRGIRT